MSDLTIELGRTDESDLDELLDVLARVPPQRLLIVPDRATGLSTFSLGVLACAALRSGATVSCLTDRGLGAGISRSLMGMLYGDAEPGGDALAQDRTEPHFLAMPAERLAQLPPTNWPKVLAGALDAAKIELSSAELYAVSAALWEAAVNACEHGRHLTREYEHSTRATSVAPAFTLALNPPHAAAERVVGNDLVAQSWLKAQRSRSPDPDGGWLQVGVYDGGMGIAFPSYYLHAPRGSSSPEEGDIYASDVSAEAGFLARPLNSRASTKGRFGSVVGSSSPPGYGLQTIARLLNEVEGFAYVRTGRLVAHLNVGTGPDRLRPAMTAHYNVSRAGLGLFLGTAWHIVLPIVRQRGLML